MLKLQFVDSSRESIWLVESRITIGSATSNHIVLQQPEIASQHAEIRSKDGEWYLLNKNPEHRVGFNGKRVKKAVKIQANDTLMIGNVKLRLVDPKATKTGAGPESETLLQEHEEWGLQATASWAEQSFYPIEHSATIGRGEDCDIVVPVSHLSRRHAQLTVAGNYLLIKDLDSTNGTFLNGEKITQGRARPGDKVRFDVVNFTVTGPLEDNNRTIVRPGFKASATASRPIDSAAARSAEERFPTPTEFRSPVSAHPQHEAVNHLEGSTPQIVPTPPPPMGNAPVMPPPPDHTAGAPHSSALVYTLIGFILVFVILTAVYLL